MELFTHVGARRGATTRTEKLAATANILQELLVIMDTIAEHQEVPALFYRATRSRNSDERVHNADRSIRYKRETV